MRSILRNLPMVLKIAVAPVILLLVFTFLGGLAFVLLTGNADSIRTLDRDVLGQRELVQECDDRLDTTMTALYRLVSIAAEDPDSAKLRQSMDDVTARIGILRILAGRIGQEIPADTVPDVNVAEIGHRTETFMKAAAQVVNIADADAGMALTMMAPTERDYAAAKEVLTHGVDHFVALEKHRVGKLLESMDLVRHTFAVTLVVIGILSIMLVGVVTRAVSTPILHLTHALESLERQDYTVAVPGLDARDELGTMARAVDALRRSASEAEELRRQRDQDRERAEQEKKAALEVMTWAVEREIHAAIEQINTPAPDTTRSVHIDKVLNNLARVIHSFSTEIY